MTNVGFTSTSTTTFATEGGNAYTVYKGTSLAVLNGDPALLATGTATGRSFNIAGNVVSEGGPAMIVGDSSTHSGAADSLKVASSGNIFGANGLVLYGDGQHVNNAGAILGTLGAGIFVDADDYQITNSGTIEGSESGIYSTGEHGRIVNTGFITSQDTAVHFLADSGTLINKGTIHASDAVDATAMKNGITIVNRGSIEGNIYLSDAADVFDTRGGLVSWTAYGRDGDDQYYVSDTIPQRIEEALNEGIDTVNASGSWTLKSNFENLFLIGKGNINGTGNELNNRILGNDGVNRLVGGAGKDEIASNGGNDFMRGGVGADTFLFETGDGRDRILDFRLGVDKLELDELDGITGFNDLMKHHLSEDGQHNAVITSGTDTLTLVGVNGQALHDTDFVF